MAWKSTTQYSSVPSTILGISAFHHDSAAAIFADGRIPAAAREERFTRSKHDQRFPTHAIQFSLSQAGIAPSAIDYIAFDEKPLLMFERLWETCVAFTPAGFGSFAKAIPVWPRQKLHLNREIRSGLGNAYQRMPGVLRTQPVARSERFLPVPGRRGRPGTKEPGLIAEFWALPRPAR